MNSGLRSTMRRACARKLARAFARDNSGASSLELIFWLGLLAPVLFSVVDLGTYVFQRMQVENAAQMAAQAAWAACPTPPGTVNGCANMSAVTSAVSTAAQSTSLGARVTATITDQYYCRTPATAALVANGASTTCTAGGPAGYYAKINATYTYAPAIAHVSIASLLAGNITKETWTRLR